MTKKKIVSLGRSDDLRRQAEEIVRGKTPQLSENLDTLSPQEQRQLLYELRVHQIELEMQNESLRQTQERLESSQLQYFNLYDLAPMGYFNLSEEGLILKANLMASSLLGLARSALVQKPLTRFIFREDQDLYYHHRQQLFKTGAAQVCELRLLKKDSSLFWARLESTVAQDSESGDTLCRSVISDITERKQAEEALRTSEARYRLLVENANEVIVVAQDGMLKFVNRMMVELFGYSEQELTSRPFLEFVHPDDRGMVVERHLKRLKGDVFQPRYAFRLVARDGSIKWVEVGAVLINWEGKPATLNFLNDITERKQAEDALRESETRFRVVMKGSPIIVAYIDRDLRYTWIYNPHPDFDPAFVQGKRDDEIAVYEGTRQLTQLKWQVIETGSTAHAEIAFLMPEGERVYDITAEPLKDDSGMVIGATTVAFDITERKQAELLLLIQRDLALAISTSHQLEEALSQCLDTILLLSEMDCGGIYLIDQESGDLNLLCHQNHSPAFIKSVAHYPADSPHTRLVLQGKPIFANYSEFALPFSQVEKAEGLKAFAVFPLIFEKQVIGSLNLSSRKLEEVSEINKQVLKTAATLIGEGITRLKIEEEFKKTNQKLQKAIKSIIKAMALVLEKRDPYTAGHQERVTKLACTIAGEIRLPKDKIEGLYMAGIIHDIGKINIPTEILSKPGRLSEIELSLIQIHPQIANDILKEMELPWEVSLIALQHHERMDGSGYPAGLSGKDIILEARILAVADVVEAMASHRPYRPALGLDKALEEITQNKDTLYDPQVVDACLKLFKEKGFKF